jgi:putative transposase
MRENDLPEKISIDKGGPNWTTVDDINTALAIPITVRQASTYKIVEPNHRAIKRRTWPTLGLKSYRAAVNVLAGIKRFNMIATINA